MSSIPMPQALEQLQALLEQVNRDHTPIEITSQTAKAVLVSKEDWSAIQETLYLLSIPGMRESIQEGLQTPLTECLPLAS